MRAIRPGGVYLVMLTGGGGTISLHPKKGVKQILFPFVDASNHTKVFFCDSVLFLFFFLHFITRARANYSRLRAHASMHSYPPPPVCVYLPTKAQSVSIHKSLTPHPHHINIENTASAPHQHHINTASTPHQHRPLVVLFLFIFYFFSQGLDVLAKMFDAGTLFPVTQVPTCLRAYEGVPLRIFTYTILSSPFARSA